MVVSGVMPRPIRASAAAEAWLASIVPLAAMIKDNHVAVAGGVAEAVRRAVAAGIERIIESRIGQKGIGFGADIRRADEKDLGAILAQVLPEDLLKFGLIPEFVGRLPVIATLEDLDIEALVKILCEPKNALIKQFQKLFDLEDVTLTFTPDALETIAKKAIERKTGARGLRSIMEGILLDTMYDLPSLEGVQEVVISEEVVNGKDVRPLYIYAERKKEEQSA